MKKEIYKLINEAADKSHILIDEPMNKHTTFRIGGNADYFVIPEKPEEVADLVRTCRKNEIPYYIIGNGSNLLVSDEGYRGVMIQIYQNISDIRIKGEELIAGAGALLSKIAKAALDYELTGFEFAAGIPGTLGGAAAMNAGAYGGELRHVIKWAKVLTEDGEVKTLDKDELELGYRTSIVSKKNYIVLEASLSLDKGNKQLIQQRMDELKEARVSKQPLEFPSAGSTFKRPEGYFAGKLIMDAGLRGFQIGGAAVAEKHCGFVINKDGATAADVISLIRHVTEEVKKQYGIRLETEVKMLGF